MEEDKKQPKVSIITPLFNSMEFIKETADSVLSQTIPDWEWIIVDGHSKDGSYEYVCDLAKNDKRIIVLIQQNNSGIGAARNEALDVATGEYIAFLDSDDMWDECFLEKQLAFAEKNGPFVCASYRRLSSGETSDYIVPELMTYKSILKGNPIAPLTAMYKRDVFLDSRFKDNSDIEDYVLWLSMLKKEGIVCHGNQEVIATYRIHGKSASSNKFKQMKRQWNAYKGEGLNFFQRSYYLMRWAFYGLKKYKNVKKGK